MSSAREREKILFVLRFNDTSTIEGHCVICQRKGENFVCLFWGLMTHQPLMVTVSSARERKKSNKGKEVLIEDGKRNRR